MTLTEINQLIEETKARFETAIKNSDFDFATALARSLDSLNILKAGAK